MQALDELMVETLLGQAVGLGEDLRLVGPTLAGGALVLDGALIHLCAFPNPEPAAANRGATLVRASRRRGLRL